MGAALVELGVSVADREGVAVGEGSSRETAGRAGGTVPVVGAGVDGVEPLGRVAASVSSAETEGAGIAVSLSV